MQDKDVSGVQLVASKSAVTSELVASSKSAATSKSAGTIKLMAVSVKKETFKFKPTAVAETKRKEPENDEHGSDQAAGATGRKNPP